MRGALWPAQNLSFAWQAGRPRVTGPNLARDPTLGTALSRKEGEPPTGVCAACEFPAVEGHAIPYYAPSPFHAA